MKCRHGMEEGQCAPCKRLADLAAQQKAEREEMAAKAARAARRAASKAEGQPAKPAKPAVDTLSDRLFNEMADGCWHTLSELAMKVGYGEASVSAGIRSLRNCMGFNVQSEMVKGGGGDRQLWHYRLCSEVETVETVETTATQPAETPAQAA